MIDRGLDFAKKILRKYLFMIDRGLAIAKKILHKYFIDDW